jgi:hypothetical protein
MTWPPSYFFGDSHRIQEKAPGFAVLTGQMRIVVDDEIAMPGRENRSDPFS